MEISAPWPEIDPVSLTLEGEVLTTGLPGKSVPFSGSCFPLFLPTRTSLVQATVIFPKWTTVLTSHWSFLPVLILNHWLLVLQPRLIIPNCKSGLVTFLLETLNGSSLPPGSSPDLFVWPIRWPWPSLPTPPPANSPAPSSRPYSFRPLWTSCDAQNVPSSLLLLGLCCSPQLLPLFLANSTLFPGLNWDGISFGIPFLSLQFRLFLLCALRTFNAFPCHSLITVCTQCLSFQ